MSQNIDNNVDKHLTQINTNDHQHNYYLYAERINSASYQLIVTCIKHSYSGVLQFDECRKKEDWDEDKLTKTLEAITIGSKRVYNQLNGHYNYVFDLKNMDDDTFLLSWSLFLYEDDDINSDSYASNYILDVTLIQDSELNTLPVILSKVMQAFNETKELNKRLEDENERLDAFCTEAYNKLNQFIKIKEENESILFTKFSLLLNEKKQRIKSLEEEISLLNATDKK